MPLSALDTLGAVKPNVYATAREVVLAAEAAMPGSKFTTLWGYDPNSQPEHSAGTAVDFMVYRADQSIDSPFGTWVADYLWTHRVRLGLRWEIWQQQIRSTTDGKPPTWVPMEDRGSITQNHFDHVHANFWERTYVPPESVVIPPAVIKEAAAMKILSTGPAPDSPVSARKDAVVTEAGTKVLSGDERYCLERIAAAKPGEYVLLNELDAYSKALPVAATPAPVPLSDADVARIAKAVADLLAGRMAS